MKLYNELIDEIDSDLIDTLGISVLTKKVLNSYDEKDSFDISNKKIEKVLKDDTIQKGILGQLAMQSDKFFAETFRREIKSVVFDFLKNK